MGEKKVTYTIRNDLKEPKFDLTTEVCFSEPVPFIKIMESAANADKKFRFSVDYYNFELGYAVETINGKTADYKKDKYFWAFLRAPDTMLDKGVSNYYPEDGEHIIQQLVKINEGQCQAN